MGDVKNIIHPGIDRSKIQREPEMEPVPSLKLLQTVFMADVWSRMDTVKAHITSTFGHILKMDSTVKVIRIKLLLLDMFVLLFLELKNAYFSRKILK